MRHLLSLLIKLERYVPGVSTQPVPSPADVRRICGDVCRGIEELLPGRWLTCDVDTMVRSTRQLIEQLEATMVPEWLEGGLLHQFHQRLAQLERVVPWTGDHQAKPLQGTYDHRSAFLTPTKYSDCLVPPKTSCSTASSHASKRTYTAVALTHETMVVTRPHQGLFAGGTLWAVGACDKPHLLEAFDFTVPGAPFFSHRDRRGMTLERAYHQLDVTQAMRTVIEQPPAAHPKVWRLLLPRLEFFVREHTQFRVIDAALCVQSRRLLYAMQPQTGHLGALHSALPEHKPLRQALVWSLAAQAFVQLGRMHEAGQHGHYNVSAQSILFNRHGEFKLAHFDHASRRGERASARPLFVGPIAAPEMVKHSCAPLQGVQLTAKADVFALATLIAEVAGPAVGRPNPFAVPIELGAAQAYDFLRKRFRLFARWQRGLAPQLGAAMSRAAIVQDDSTFGLFFAPLAQLAPDLCDLLFSSALTESCWHRVDAMSIARHVLEHCSPPYRHADGQSLLIDAMQKLDEECHVSTLTHEARAFRAWHGAIPPSRGCAANG